ncbi:MAG: DUF4142 domain-containing protein [Ginsengibacter sp.]
MKSNSLFKVLVTSAIACIIIFSTPALAQENIKLSNADVASVMVLANQLYIEYSAIAQQKTKNVDILKFAKKIAEDHKIIKDHVVAVVHKIKVAPRNNVVSQKLWEDAVQAKIMLRSTSGNAFNKAYIDNEVAYHKTVIDTLENTLIPNVENQELHALLQNIVPTLKAQLKDAIEMRNKIS